jgi:origin recognition complex subunit 5
VPHIHFPAYTKAEALQILSLDVPPIHNVSPSPSQPSPGHGEEEDTKFAKESREVWSRFISVVWDSLAKHSGRDILSLRDICMKLWPSFTQPLRDGTYYPKDFSRLLVSKRTLFQDERVLVPSIICTTVPLPTTAILAPNDVTSQHNLPPTNRGIEKAQSITSQLPHTTRLLLIAAYLASYTPARTDTLLFVKSNEHLRSRKRKRSHPGAPRARPSKHRKIARNLLGPQAFVAERMLAIFWALVQNNDGGSCRIAVAPGSADVPMAIATLASLRLLVKSSPSADVLDAGTKWKVNIGWDVVRAVARSIGVEVEEYFWEE